MTMSRRRTAFVLTAGTLAALATSPRITAAEPAVKSGSASGAFSTHGKSATLAYAAAFRDQRDDKKPVVLVLSDKELPASTWKNGSDMSAWRREHQFLGVAFWIDEKDNVFRCEYYDGTSFPTSTTGVFDLKVARAAGSLTGTAKSTQAAARLTDPVALDATFNAPLK